MKPLVSVIMSTYNETEQELDESIDSVLNQTYSNIELIIINDNPCNKKLKNKLDLYNNHAKIKIIENQSNLGPAISRTKGVKAAKGFYTAILDADDVAYLNRIEKQVDYLEKNQDCDLVASNRDDINESSEIIKKSAGIIVNEKKLKKILKYSSIITHSSIMIKTSILKELNGYRNLPSAQDYDLLLRIISKGYNIHILPEVLIKYRVRQTGITNSNFAKQYFCNKYARLLYKERLKSNNIDSFNVNKLNSLLQNSKVNSALNEQKNQLAELIAGKNIVKNTIKILFNSILYRENFLNLLNIFYIQIILRLFSI